MPATTKRTRGNVGAIGDELAKRHLLTKSKRHLGQNELLPSMNQSNKVMKKSRKGIKVTQGIIVNDLKINIYEMKKEYEVHVIFNPANGDLVFEERLDGTIDYLAQEGYFDKKKKIKVIGMAFKGSMDNGSFFNSDE